MKIAEQESRIEHCLIRIAYWKLPIKNAYWKLPTQIYILGIAARETVLKTAFQISCIENCRLRCWSGMYRYWNYWMRMTAITTWKYVLSYDWSHSLAHIKNFKHFCPLVYLWLKISHDWTYNKYRKQEGIWATMCTHVNLVPRLLSSLPVAAPPFCCETTLVVWLRASQNIGANGFSLQGESLSVTVRRRTTHVSWITLLPITVSPPS